MRFDRELSLGNTSKMSIFMKSSARHYTEVKPIEEELLIFKEKKQNIFGVLF